MQRLLEEREILRIMSEVYDNQYHLFDGTPMRKEIVNWIGTSKRYDHINPKQIRLLYSDRAQVVK